MSSSILSYKTGLTDVTSLTTSTGSMNGSSIWLLIHGSEEVLTARDQVYLGEHNLLTIRHISICPQISYSRSAHVPHNAPNRAALLGRRERIVEPFNELRIVYIGRSACTYKPPG